MYFNINKKDLKSVSKHFINNNIASTIPDVYHESNKTPTLSNVIKLINEDTRFNLIASTSIININLNNFSYFNKLLFNKKNKEAFYNVKNQNIIIEQGVIDYISNTYLDSNFNKQDLFNIILLHEIGHAIHHQIFLNNKKITQNKDVKKEFFLNSLILYGHDFSSKNKYLDIINTSFIEGFADMYSFLVLKYLYNNHNFQNLLDKQISIREKSNNSYYTKPCLSFLKNNDFIINDFFDTQKIIFEQITKNTLCYLNNFLLDTGNDSQKSYFLGVLNSILKIPEKNINDTQKIIKQEFPFLNSFDCKDIYFFNVAQQEFPKIKSGFNFFIPSIKHLSNYLINENTQENSYQKKMKNKL